MLPAAPVVELETLRVQFAATLDTQITLGREAVRLTRWLTLTPRDGTLFSPKLEGLMPGEEIDSVRTADDAEPIWQKTAAGLVFPDNGGIAPGKPWTVIVSTRLDPDGWQGMSAQPLALLMASATVPGAGKINGYVALDFDEALLVGTTAAAGLESRDPRQFRGVLPLKGQMAWSRLDTYQLDLKVSRRAPEYDASVVLYALPLLNSLEVEGAVNLTIDRSPIKEVRVGFPEEAAAAVRWDSPLLAESVLEADHTWRLRFHQETDGAPVLRFRLSLPLTDATDAALSAEPGKAGAAVPERRFKATPPVPSVPGARRWSGSLMVEANTDTELSFAATGLNAMDTLRVPALEGYVPRHRLVSAWTWLGGTPVLTVNGVRHRPGGLVSTVVDRLKLDTVISQDGLVRHQAGMEVRTAGDQYLDVILPEAARVLTLLVNGAAVKPVRNRQGGLRVPLSGNLAVIRLICECPGEPMTSASSRKLMPITLDPALPVLDMAWQLHLPEGYSYSGFDSNLTLATGANPATPGVLGLAMAELNASGGMSFLPGGGGGKRVITVEQWRQMEAERVQRITAVLAGKLKQQEEEVETARIAMLEQMKEHGIVDLGFANGRGTPAAVGIGEQTYSQQKSTVEETRAKRDQLKALLEKLQNLSGEALIDEAETFAVEDATIAKFSGQYKTDKVEYGRMLNSGFGSSHPTVIGLQKQMETERAILLSAGEKYREALAVHIKNLDQTLQRQEEISRDKKVETVEEKQAAAEYATSKTQYEMKLDLLNQMRETFLKTQVNESLPREPGQVSTKGAIFSDSAIENRFSSDPPEYEIAPEPSPAPAAGGLQTRTYKVPPDYLSKGADASGSGLAKRPDAKTVLTQLGIEFDEGAVATFSADSSTLVVRNSLDQLDHVEQVSRSLQASPAGAADRFFGTVDSDRAGLLPLDFALPEGGRVYRFAGQYAPGALAFHYESWERRMQWSWFWMISGGVAFWLLGRRSPWFIGALGILLLHFIPEVTGKLDGVPVANALLLGWVAGGLLRVVSWALRRKPAEAPVLLAKGQAVGLILAVLAGMGGQGQAEEGSAKSAADVPVVVVPYDPAQPMDQALPDRRYLSYETFGKLWAAAKLNRSQDAARAAAQPASGDRGATLTSALHRAVVDGAVLRVEAVFALQTRGPDWVKVPFGMPGGLRSLSLDGSPAALQGKELLVEKAGAHVVLAAYDVPLPAGWQEVGWEVPAASATSLALSLAMSDPARPEVNGGAPLVEVEQAGRRVFTATLGTTTKVTLKRRTSAERAGGQAELPPLASVKTRTYVSASLERVEAAVDYAFVGQSRSAFTLRMDAALTPVRFSVPGLENWALRQEGGMQVLELRLERPVSDGFSMTLVAERPVGTLPLTEKAPEITAAAARVERAWTVLATDDLEIKPQAGAGHQRVEFVSAPGTGDEGFDPVGTWQASGAGEPPAWALQAKVPEASAVVRYALQPGAGKLELSAGMELHPAPGRELRELTIRVPAGVTIQGVTGDRLADWWHEDTALQVRFSSGAEEVTRLALNLTQPMAAEATEVVFTPLQIEGFPKVSGSGLLIAPVNQDAVLRLAPVSPSLREIAPQDTSSGFTIRPPFEEKRGFVFEGTAWTASAALTPLSARYDVDWVLDAEVRDGWVGLNTRVLVSLSRGGLERLSFTTPAAAPEFRITGDDVRETVNVVEGAVRRYTVSFQTLMTGAALFTITGQVPLQAKASLPDFEFTGAARTARFIIVENRSEGEMGLKLAGCVVTPREQVSFLPEELANGSSSAQFYEARPGWSMEVAVEKLETSAGQAALVLHADLTTSLLRNGEVWQQAVYVVQNRALQFLPVRLPEDAEVISVMVGGVTTRADRGVVEGMPVFLVPLIQTAAGELATEVKLIYRRRGEPGRFPDLMEDPDLPGLAVGQTFWTVQYPDGYALDVDGGNMTSTDDAGLSTEKTLSRLSELVSLRRIAKSDKYDEETRNTARRNAQAVVSNFQASKDQRLDDDIAQAVRETQEDVVAPAAAEKKPVDRKPTGGELKAKEFRYNNKSQTEVESLGKKIAGPGADELTLNDNVAWSAKKDAKPVDAKPNAGPAAGNRRLSQFNKFERGVLEDKKEMADRQDVTKSAVVSASVADAKQQEAFKSQNSDYSFRNSRLNQGLAVNQISNAPATATLLAPEAASKPAAAPAEMPAADLFAASSVAGFARVNGGSDNPVRLLQTSGRSSLEAVFPAQSASAHFRKVKGDAVLRLKVAKPLLAGVNRAGAAAFAGWAGALFLARWLYVRMRRPLGRRG